MRRLIAFPCKNETLVGALDEGTGNVGVLIVSGGNEVRVGAHRGMATLAAALAERGIAVFRFDRRGIGDSSGSNAGFLSTAPDIAAALDAFRQAAPGMQRVIGFGNCDAATALVFFRNGLDALILANPWIGGSSDALPPAAAIRARYATRLRDLRTWWRLVTGGIALRKLLRGLRKIAAIDTEETALADRMASALAERRCPITVLLARQDNTAMAFRAAWSGAAFDAVRDRVTVRDCDTASHSFATPSDKAWLYERIIEATR